MNIDMTMFHQTFFEEAADLLSDLEVQLLRLEENPNDTETLNTIFRCAHSIKGGSATFGFTDIAQFTHGLETLLDRLRNGEMQVNGPLIRLLLESQDQLLALLNVARGLADSAPDSSPLSERIHAAIDGGLEDDAPVGSAAATAASVLDGTAPETSAATPKSTPRKFYSLKLIPGAEVAQHGSDVTLLVTQFLDRIDALCVSCNSSRLPALSDLNPEACYLTWEIDFATEEEPDALLETFDFIADESEIGLTRIGGDTPAITTAEASQPEPAAVTIAAEVTAEASADVAGLFVNAPAPAAAAVPVASAALAAPAPKLERTAVTPNASKVETHTLRVATDKVDKLINLVGELVINQSMLNEVVQDFSMAKLPRLVEAVAEMERASRELQERVMAIRMLPIKHAFGRFPRIVHDQGATVGKKIELKMTGEETELDKTVIEMIGDPLTHLVRNSIDHGLELPDERVAAGKSEVGTVSLNAFHEGGSIVIVVSDDGRGLDRDRILKKAIERGLLSETDPTPSDDVIYNFIFQAGFSTAATVTDLSGRGVGMDIVRQAVQSLGGSIALSSNPGKGSRTRIRLPLTMAILEGLSLAVGDEVYILPLTSIVESIRPKPGDVRMVAGHTEVAMVRGEVLPIMRLYHVFGAQPRVTDPTKGLLVIVENDSRKVALLVDELIGQSQVVIKSLESNYRKVDGIAGATILGDGRVALIVDVPGLVRGSGMFAPRLAA